MRLRRDAPVAVVEPVGQPHLPVRAADDMSALVAAAALVRLDSGSSMRTVVSDQDWQREAWRHLDICGELRFAANRHAAALSQCRLFVAELDDLGKPGEETKEPKVRALGESVFGGPAAKTEQLRQLGIDYYVGGEGYIVAEGATDTANDAWYIVTANQVRKTGGDGFKVKRPSTIGGGWRKLDPETDLLMRTWTPHPRDYDLADSPVRSALTILREIERLTLLAFSQIDSRLVSAGIISVPAGSSFPKKDGVPGDINDLMQMLLEVAKAQLTGAGTAAGLVPILIETPMEAGSKPEHLTFSTPLTAELATKLDQAIKRLAIALDIAPEELLGLGDSNHWSAWSIDETGIKLFIQPVMTRICDALTRGYLHPALKSIGVKDFERFTFWFDTSPLTVRPNRFEDAGTLYDKGELSGDELRKSGNFSDDSAPKAKELAAINARWAVALDPTLLQQEAYAKLLGLPVSAPPPPPAPPGMEDPNALPPGEDPAARDGEISGQLGLPKTPSGGNAPAMMASARPALTAAGAAQGLLPGAEQIVLRALELAGARMLTGKGRNSMRGQYADVARHELHTRIRPTDREHALRLVDGAFVHAPSLVSHFGAYGFRVDDVTRLLEGYCAELLVRGFAHEPDFLQAYIERAVEVMIRASPVAA